MTAASPYRSLEAERWRFLMALGVVFLAIGPKLSRLSAMARQSTFVGAALARLFVEAEHLAHGGDDEDDDDARVVTKVVRAWDAELAKILAYRGLEPPARQLLTQLRSLLAGTVACDPYRLMFDRIEARAHGLYGDAWRPAVLSVAHTRSHPRGSDVDPYPVTALTPWPPGEAAAEIELLVCCDQFGPEAFAAVPMLLTHECVSHVPARQDRAKNDSAFAEGFMDWAAYHFLDQWAADLGPELAPAARKHAEGLRHVLTDRGGGMAGQARRDGHEAAEALFAWFESECGLPLWECRIRVARLAVELNQVDVPIVCKDHFVYSLEQPFPRELVTALRAWVRGELDTKSLLDAPPSALVCRSGPHD